MNEEKQNWNHNAIATRKLIVAYKVVANWVWSEYEKHELIHHITTIFHLLTSFHFLSLSTQIIHFTKIKRPGGNKHAFYEPLLRISCVSVFQMLEHAKHHLQLPKMIKYDNWCCLFAVKFAGQYQSILLCNHKFS